MKHLPICLLLAATPALAEVKDSPNLTDPVCHIRRHWIDIQHCDLSECPPMQNVGRPSAMDVLALRACAKEK
jgi:hypothetical protein